MAGCASSADLVNSLLLPLCVAVQLDWSQVEVQSCQAGLFCVVLPAWGAPWHRFLCPNAEPSHLHQHPTTHIAGGGEVAALVDDRRRRSQPDWAI